MSLKQKKIDYHLMIGKNIKTECCEWKIFEFLSLIYKELYLRYQTLFWKTLTGNSKLSYLFFNFQHIFTSKFYLFNKLHIKNMKMLKDSLSKKIIYWFSYITCLSKKKSTFSFENIFKHFELNVLAITIKCNFCSLSLSLSIYIYIYIYIYIVGWNKYSYIWKFLFFIFQP